MFCWSCTSTWNSSFSALRSSPAFLTATSVSAILLSASAIAAFRVAIDASNDSIFCSKSAFSSSAVKVSFSFVFKAALQLSLKATSSACSCFKSATILSIISFTLVKLSSCTETARVASCERGPTRLIAEFRAFQPLSKSSAAKEGERVALRNDVTARTRRICIVVSALTCKKATLFKASRASSSVRIAIVSEIAVISALRPLLRAAQSLSMLWHSSLTFCKNFTSADR
mmetsp:Transcript_118939/g.222343  ORF Transcript_118939/g.222343 Transcript_118939/m.222343 type:complete len:229 (+) Transcript_118939:582-1268(+)